MKKNFLNTTLIFVFFAGLSFIAKSAFAEDSQIYIKIGEAKTKKSLLAFPPFQNASLGSANANTVGAELFNVISNDLSVSSYFQFISQNAFLEDSSKVGLRPAPAEPNGFKFQSWSSIGADFLIRGSYSVIGKDVELEIYLYHVPKAGLVFAKKYKGTVAAARRIAHTFSNDVLKNLTDKTGMFLSRVVVSSDRSNKTYKEIYTMDWDGAHLEKVTDHKTISLSPAWAPDGRRIAYTSYVQRARTKMRNADMFLYDVTAGTRKLFSYRLGINSGASFSPDGKFVFLTISQGNSPDIYKIATDSDFVKKITNGPNSAMNVEPAVSPDGKQVAFSSDRSGRPMIYVMDIDGSNIRRITFAGVFNSSPSWSSDGKKLAFAGQSGDNFDIFVVSTDGSNMIRLTTAKKANGRAANNEDPSFSPDGRFVMYTSNRSGKNQIFISTADGSEERRVTNDSYNYFKPKWSANLD
ncbi:MAG: translocation protein TolB [Bdellovibrionota bacterium]